MSNLSKDKRWDFFEEGSIPKEGLTGKGFYTDSKKATIISNLQLKHEHEIEIIVPHVPRGGWFLTSSIVACIVILIVLALIFRKKWQQRTQI